jgi:hypothetical protein
MDLIKVKPGWINVGSGLRSHLVCRLLDGRLDVLLAPIGLGA